MVGTTWKLKTSDDFDYIVAVVRLNEQRDAWVCVVILDSGGEFRSGDLVSYQEPTLQARFRRIG